MPDAGTNKVQLPPAPAIAPAPRGLPETPSPSYNPTTPEKVALGKLLFFDKKLSGNGSQACASCHQPTKGWTDGAERSTTAAGKLNLRHTPSLYNVAYARALLWDGSGRSIETTALNHWAGQLAAAPDLIVGTLARSPLYVAHFQRAFSSPPTRDHVAAALAAFVRTLRSGNSPWDRHELGEPNAVSLDAIAGQELFSGRAQCHLCHPPPHYTDWQFHNKGIGAATQSPDRGRIRATKHPQHDGQFRTPTLRGAAHTAPYFHDGSAPTLRDAVVYSLSGGFRSGNATLDRRLERIELTSKEVDQLVAFLRALSR